MLAPPRNFVKISDNSRCRISADWKIWEILGGDKALVLRWNDVIFCKNSE